MPPVSELNIEPISAHEYNRTIQWRTVPLLVGTTKFEPRDDVKNIMITGGAGFIGSWVVRHLTLTYPTTYRVVCFDKIDYCATENNIEVLKSCENFRFCYGNVKDENDVMRCIKDNKIDTIMHFAAQSHVDLSFGNSFEFTATNVQGTHVMLESAVKLGVKRFIHVSTDEVNGETGHGDADLTEESILKPTNPYAASKAAAEMYVNAYHKSFSLPVIIVRSNNVYGPHQYPEKIIPKFASLLDRSKPLILHGNGTHTRRYLHASDSADAFDTILHLGQTGQTYNVDSRHEISNLDLAHLMLSHFDIPPDPESAAEWIQHVTDRPFNDKRYAVDATKLRSLGWEQKVDFESGLKDTIDWYRQYGRCWWSNVESVLTPFPEVRSGTIWSAAATTTPDVDENRDMQSAPASAHVNGAAAAKSKKRAYEPEGKENVDSDGAVGSKRVMLGHELSGIGETVR